MAFLIGWCCSVKLQVFNNESATSAPVNTQIVLISGVALPCVTECLYKTQNPQGHVFMDIYSWMFMKITFRWFTFSTVCKELRAVYKMDKISTTSQQLFLADNHCELDDAGWMHRYTDCQTQLNNVHSKYLGRH